MDEHEKERQQRLRDRLQGSQDEEEDYGEEEYDDDEGSSGGLFSSQDKWNLPSTLKTRRTRIGIGLIIGAFVAYMIINYVVR